MCFKVNLKLVKIVHMCSKVNIKSNKRYIVFYYLYKIAKMHMRFKLCICVIVVVVIKFHFLFVCGLIIFVYYSYRLMKMLIVEDLEVDEHIYT